MVREIAVNKAQISQFASGGPQTIPAFQPEISGFRFRQKANDRRSGFQSHRHAVNHSRWSHWLCQMARLQSECALIFLFPLDCYLFCRCVRELHAGRWSLHDFRHSSKDGNSSVHRQHGKAGLNECSGCADLWSAAAQHLYTHERYTDHNVLLGFGDGEIQHIDMRVQHKMCAYPVSRACLSALNICGQIGQDARSVLEGRWHRRLQLRLELSARRRSS